MKKKYYLHCPNCNTRMRRTGRKEEEHYGLYLREYECPGCGRLWTYSEYRNMFYMGGLDC